MAGLPLQNDALSNLQNLALLARQDDESLIEQQVQTLLQTGYAVARYPNGNRDLSRAYNVMQKIYRAQNGAWIVIKHWHQCIWCNVLMKVATKGGTSQLLRHIENCRLRPPNYVLPVENLHIAARQRAQNQVANPANNNLVAPQVAVVNVQLLGNANQGGNTPANSVNVQKQQPVNAPYDNLVQGGNVPPIPVNVQQQQLANPLQLNPPNNNLVQGGNEPANSLSVQQQQPVNRSQLIPSIDNLVQVDDTLGDGIVGAIINDQPQVSANLSQPNPANNNLVSSEEAVVSVNQGENAPENPMNVQQQQQQSAYSPQLIPTNVNLVQVNAHSGGSSACAIVANEQQQALANSSQPNQVNNKLVVSQVAGVHIETTQNPNQGGNALVAGEVNEQQQQQPHGIINDADLAVVLARVSEIGILYGNVSAEDFLTILPSAEGTWRNDFFDQVKRLASARSGIKDPRVVLRSIVKTPVSELESQDTNDPENQTQADQKGSSETVVPRTSNAVSDVGELLAAKAIEPKDDNNNKSSGKSKEKSRSGSSDTLRIISLAPPSKRSRTATKTK